MDILKKLKEISSRENCPFILIGGHAMNIYGLSRQTGDIDLLIPENDRETWKNILLNAKYALFHEQSAFMQFSPPSPSEWPIDFMLVDSDTYSQISEQSLEKEIDEVKISVPGLTHLMALKLHALNQESRRRELKDMDDLIGLLENSDMDIRGDEFRDLCFKFADNSIYEQIITQWERGHDD